MKKSILIFLFAILVLFTGCVSQQTYSDMKKGTVKEETYSNRFSILAQWTEELIIPNSNGTIVEIKWTVYCDNEENIVYIESRNTGSGERGFTIMGDRNKEMMTKKAWYESLQTKNNKSETKNNINTNETNKNDIDTVNEKDIIINNTINNN